MVCQNCGSQEFNILPDGSGCCRYCGNIIPGMGPGRIEQQFNNQFNNVSSSLQSGRKDKTIALILSLILGWCGGQYFYLGKTVLGVICVLFCWTGIPSIIGLVYFVILLSMSDQNFNEKFNTPTK